MTIIHELCVEDFEPWSGAVNTYERIYNAGKLHLLEQILDDLYCDRETITDTELNDLLWFESETVYDWLGMKTDDELSEEKEAIKEKRNAVQRLLVTDDAEVFCGLWLNNLEQDCHDCPLYRSVDCEDHYELVRNRKEIIEAAKNIEKDLDEEEEDLE